MTVAQLVLARQEVRRSCDDSDDAVSSNNHGADRKMWERP